MAAIPNGSKQRFMKAQISFEFMAMFIAIMLAFLFFFAIYSEFNTVTHQQTQRDNAKTIASEIADAVNAILPSDNSSVLVQIQHGYNITSGVRSILATDNFGFAGSASILTDWVNITLPENSTNITIRNSGGQIYISGN